MYIREGKITDQVELYRKTEGKSKSNDVQINTRNFKLIHRAKKENSIEVPWVFLLI